MMDTLSEQEHKVLELAAGLTGEEFGPNWVYIPVQNWSAALSTPESRQT